VKSANPMKNNAWEIGGHDTYSLHSNLRRVAPVPMIVSGHAEGAREEVGGHDTYFPSLQSYVVLLVGWNRGILNPFSQLRDIVPSRT
jgi:hypothetical protein